MANAPRDGNSIPALLLTYGAAAIPAAGDASGRLSTTLGSAATGTYATVAVDGTADLVLAANTARKGFILVNNGGTDCYIGFSASVVSGAAADAHGGALLKSGGSFSMSMVDGYTGALYGITAGGNTVVAAMEW